MRYFCFILLFIGLGCGPTIIYENTYEVGEEWSYDEIMKFDFNIQDTTQLYNLEFVLTHDSEFDFQNLYTQIKTTYPNENVVVDKISFQLANKLGGFSGNCNGNKCVVTIVLQELFRFQNIGNHTIDISQFSRIKKLPGIYKGKLKLVEAAKE